MLLVSLLPLSAAIAKEEGSRQKAVNQLWKKLNDKKLKLRSESALIVDRFNNPIYGKAIDTALPIASITKIMMAIVILDSKLPLDEKIKITKADRDLIKLTGSRLKYGARLTRKELLHLALMSSENRAAAALGRTYPGGTQAFVRAMNAKAKSLGMHNSRFADPAGLKPENLASPQDLVKLIRAAGNYPEIHNATTQKSLTVYPYNKKGPLKYANTNRLLKNKKWSIELSKTGYINEAGRCLVMQADIAGQPVVIVLLNSFGKLTPFGDANRIKKWIENGVKQQG
ncbi:MAG: D-alanyl-D-alanine endopeptidase [Gammaproteobacteria bacterium]|nr:D-alanyl-D-alanine endopeptidase [Gammaproteobacteria bacterium]